MNPFEFNSPINFEEYYNWEEIYPMPYNSKTASPYTKARVILMNGCETENAFFLHNFMLYYLIEHLLFLIVPEEP